MMDRRYTTLVLVCLLALAATPGVATAAASPEDPCGGTDGTEARLFLDTNEQIDRSQQYYPGTTVTMYVCQDGERQKYPAAWGFNPDAVDGISVVNEREYSIVFTLEGGVESVTPTAGVENRPDIVPETVPIQIGYRAESSITGDTVRFPSESASSEFSSAEGDWRESIEQMRNASETLANVDSESNLSATAEPISTLNESTLSQEATELQRSAIPAARAGDGGAAAMIVTESSNATAEAKANARDSLRSYIDTVRERRRAAVRSVRLFVGGGLAGGLVVGAVAGYALSRRTLSKIERDRGVSTATQYSPKQVALPLVLGVLALLIGLAVGALNWPTFFEVIL